MLATAAKRDRAQPFGCLFALRSHQEFHLKHPLAVFELTHASSGQIF